MFKDVKELYRVFKESNIVGVRNNLQYKIDKLDMDINKRKEIIRQIKDKLKSTRK